MQVEVDTSGWLDDFEKPSTVGFSNGRRGAIRLSKSLKLEATKLLRRQGKSRAFCKARLFVIALYLLLRPHLRDITQITIDRDFQGWEGEIISMLVSYLQRHNPHLSADRIRFDDLRGHDCHVVANAAFRGEFSSVEPNPNEFLQLVAVRGKKAKK